MSANNGRPHVARPSVVRSHPNGPRLTDDGKLILSPATTEPDLRALVNMLTVKLDVVALGLDAMITAEQENGARLDRLIASTEAIGDKLDKLGTAIDSIKLPPFLTRK